MTDTRDPAEIERELDRTRERLHAHIEELQDKVSPAQLANDTLSFIGERTGVDLAGDMLGRARANPAAVALIAAGIGWLLTSRPIPAGAPVLAAPNPGTGSAGAAAQIPDSLRIGAGVAALGALAALVLPVHPRERTAFEGQAAGLRRRFDQTARSLMERASDVPDARATSQPA